MAIGHKTTAAISSVVTAAVLISASALAPKDFREPDSGERSGHWPAVRKAFLATHPTCAACGTTDDLECHHCISFKHDPRLELDESNLIVLCRKSGHNCHFCIGHAMDFKHYNPFVREDAARMLKRIKERKTSFLRFPTHCWRDVG